MALKVYRLQLKLWWQRQVRVLLDPPPTRKTAWPPAVVDVAPRYTSPSVARLEPYFIDFNKPYVDEDRRPGDFGLNLFDTDHNAR